jgi:hypothetical protein
MRNMRDVIETIKNMDEVTKVKVLPKQYHSIEAVKKLYNTEDRFNYKTTLIKTDIEDNRVMLYYFLNPYTSFSKHTSVANKAFMKIFRDMGLDWKSINYTTDNKTYSGIIAYTYTP